MMLLLTLGLLLQGPADPIEVRAALEAGLFGQAMGLARGIPDEHERLSLEAEVLYLARSYDESLGRVQAALELGPVSAQTLSRGVSAAIWVGSEASGRELLQTLEAVVEGLPVGDRPAWLDHTADLEAYLDALTDRRASARAAGGRARWVAGLMGLLGLGLLGAALRPRAPA